MQHFVTDDGFNAFRLPVGWQFLTNDILGGTLNDTNFEKYNALVQVHPHSGTAAWTIIGRSNIGMSGYRC